MIDVGVISDDPTTTQYVVKTCEEFGYTVEKFPGLEAFMETSRNYSVVLAVNRNTEKAKESAAEMAQAVRFACKDAFLVCAVTKNLPKEAVEFAKKSGSNVILLHEELVSSGKLEFILTQVLRANFFPIKVIDLMPDRAVNFDIYHLMPQRNKFLKFIFSGDILDTSRIAKISGAGELYIARAEIKKYEEYCYGNNDASSGRIAARCRSKFLALYANFSELVLLLTDQSAVASYKEGEILLSRCKTLCEQLLGALGEFENPSEIINNSTIGEFGSVERGPAVAAYAAVFGLRMGLKNIDQIMLCALLSNLGLLFLPPEVLRCLRDDRLDSMDDVSRKIYEKYVLLSLDLILNRKLSFDSNLRTIMLAVHERADGNGFPKGISGIKIPEESQLIRFAREFDRRTVLRMNKPRPDSIEIRKQMLLECGIESTEYTIGFKSKLLATLS